MCEWCGKVDASETVALPADEAEDCLCEDESEVEPEHMCGAPAKFRSKDRYVEMHICERHLRARKEEFGGGLGELLTATGLAEEIVVKPIQGKERCEDSDLGSSAECGRPAGYAYIVTSESYSCERHRPGAGGKSG